MTNVVIGTIDIFCFCIKPIFHLATSFARREAKTRIRQRDWLKLTGEKIRREQVRTVLLTFFLFARTNSSSGKQALVTTIDTKLNRNCFAFCKFFSIDLETNF